MIENTTELVERVHTRLKDEEKALKTVNKMLKELIDEDDEVLALTAEIKDYKIRLDKRKEQIKNENAHLLEQQAKIKTNKKACEQVLTNSLLQYHQETGKTQIEIKGKLYNANFKSKPKETDQVDMFDGMDSAEAVETE